MINIAAPIIEDQETQAVLEVMQSGILAQGPKVAELEESFARYCGTKYAAAVNSGTAAIHSALHAVGVREGDEVITTPYSFIATINPILMLGAKPVLVDIDSSTFNIDPQKIEAAITSRTKAIVPVHLYGQVCDWKEIHDIASRHNLRIIEDACQAIGAEYEGKKAGSLGDAGCFSLYATKNIMCGEGGMVTTNDEECLKAIKAFRQHGMTAPYEYAELGYNYRMTDLQAAIAIEQLKKADSFNQARQKNAKALDRALGSVKGITIPALASSRNHVYHQYTVIVSEEASIGRDEAVTALKEREVGAGVYYPKPLHVYPHIQKLGYKVGDFPVAESTAKRVLSLPIHPKLTDSDIKQIIVAVQEVFRG